MFSYMLFVYVSMLSFLEKSGKNQEKNLFIPSCWNRREQDQEMPLQCRNKQH